MTSLTSETHDGTKVRQLTHPFLSGDNWTSLIGTFMHQNIRTSDLFIPSRTTELVFKTAMTRDYERDLIVCEHLDFIISTPSGRDLRAGAITITWSYGCLASSLLCCVSLLSVLEETDSPTSTESLWEVCKCQHAAALFSTWTNDYFSPAIIN